MNNIRLKYLRRVTRDILAEYAPVTRKDLITTLKIGSVTLCDLVTAMKNMNEIYLVRGIGYFLNETQFHDWEMSPRKEGSGKNIKDLVILSSEKDDSQCKPAPKKKPIGNRFMLYLRPDQRSGWDYRKGFNKTATIGDPKRVKQ